MLTYEQIAQNGQFFKKQISRLSISAETGPDARQYRLARRPQLHRLSQGHRKHFSVNRMLSFETYKMRLETGLSFIEFNYQLLQSYISSCSTSATAALQRAGTTSGKYRRRADLVRGSRERRRTPSPSAVTRSDGKRWARRRGSLFLDPEMVSPTILPVLAECRRRGCAKIPPRSPSSPSPRLGS
jgi:tyrosyl-tRNA synthetase